MKLLLLVSFLSLWRRSDGTGAALINVLVKEGGDAILPCSFSNKNIRQDLFDWKKDKKNKKDMKEVFMYDKGKVYDKGDSRQDEQFRGRVFHFPEHLDVGNASIIIRDTKLTDSGNYTCVFPHHDPDIRSNIVLVVDPILKDRSDDNISGATHEPSVTILNANKDWALLRCVVRGASPKPDVRWQNRAGDIVPAEEPQVSERGGSYDIILQTTVTKTDNYSCVSTQEEIHHQIYTETYVPVHDNLSCHCTSVPMVVIITLIVALVIEHLGGFLVKTIMNQRKKKLKCWSRGCDVERDATQAEAVELKSQLPEREAEPDEAEAGHPLNNGSGSTQTTL